MAETRISITNLDEIRDNINDIVGRVGSEIMRRSGLRIRELISDDLREEIRQAFFRTDVYRGLNGDGDLLAHLGLNISDGSYAADQIADSISESIGIADLQFRGAGGRFASVNTAISLTFSIKVEDIEERLNQAPFGTYESDAGPIPWLNWLIYGNATVDASILFTDSINSRSGSAIMVKSTPKLGGNWSIDDYDRFASGAYNFILQMYEDEQFISNLELAVERAFRQALEEQA